jgi:hypothetical protein
MTLASSIFGDSRQALNTKFNSERWLQVWDFGMKRITCDVLESDCESFRLAKCLWELHNVGILLQQVLPQDWHPQPHANLQTPPPMMPQLDKSTSRIVSSQIPCILYLHALLQYKTCISIDPFVLLFYWLDMRKLYHLLPREITPVSHVWQQWQARMFIMKVLWASRPELGIM